MRVDAYNAVNQLYQATSKTEKTKTEKTNGKKDAVEISQIGKDINVAKQAIKNVPDVREDKVAAIKKQLEEGTYQVSDQDIADKLVERFFEGI